jgi:hypothetical protein
MSGIEVKAMGPHEYAVVVTEGRTTTHHRVRVPVRLVDELGIDALDETVLVRESFAFLLEREPGSAILREFGLDVIARYFPEYPAEIKDRLTG